MITKDPK